MSGSPGSRRSERPRICCTDTPVAATAEVDEAVDLPGSPSPRRAARACRPARRRRRSPARASPAPPTRAAPTRRRRSAARRARRPARPPSRAARGGPRPAATSAVEQHVGVRRQAAQAAAGDQQRAQRRGAQVGAERDQRVPGRAGRRVEHAAEQRGRAWPRRARRRTAPAPRSASPRDSISAASTSTSPSAFACEPVSSRSTSDVPRRMPAAREPEAELAERGRDGRVAVGRLGRRRGVQAAQRVVLEQHEPVLEVGRAPVRLAARRAVGQAQPGRGEEAHAGARQRRAAALEVLPRHLGVVVGRRGGARAGA